MRYHLFAPAKVNLDLAITGRRPDMYHTLRSHVAFADVGDVIEMDVTEAGMFSCGLTLNGPFAYQLTDEDPHKNLVARAARAFCDTYGHKLKIKLTLTKNIPCGSGLGGGSSDAAAVLRGLAAFVGKDIDMFDAPFLTAIGADVPVCLHAQPCVMEGIGEVLSPWSMEDTDVVLIWPGPGGSTKALYKAWAAQPVSVSGGNDFEPVARALCPGILPALAALKSMPGCREARLSGSGTAVFGLFNAPPALSGLNFSWVQPCKIGQNKKPLVTSGG